MTKAKYVVGIDLGTTNCTMAYAKLQDEEKTTIYQFLIPQITTSGTQEELSFLPSYIYFPLTDELKSKAAGISWNPERNHVVGTFARNRGAELPSRLIASAKSWLCHSGIERREKLLPIGSDQEQEKMSPIEACAALLKHLQEAWDDKMLKDPFDQQQIYITVPASFDPSARQLVQEAAEKVGYPDIILLEEPQAAFYAWLHNHSELWRKQLKVGDIVLVVDVGGGTTDFSLISVNDDNGNLGLNRLAVGSHLLLGGDNMDLALAYIAKNSLEDQGHALDDWQVQALVHSCRQAKENLMSELPPESVDITIQGRGSRLIGGSLTTKISYKQAYEVLVNGFVPLVSPEEISPNERRTGMQQVGLPYAQDARISCQLAKFLSMSGESINGNIDHFVVPTAILFNGGTLKAQPIRERLVELLNQWAEEMEKEPVKVLPNPDYDLAVGRGAVCYGLARFGKGVRIKGGTSRSYYIGVEDALPAVPGVATPLKAVCVVPFGMEEGTEQELSGQEFALVLGEQATFRFFSRITPQLSNGVQPTIGTIVKSWKTELTELHPIETMLDKMEADGKVVRIKLKSKITELGVLELWCVAEDSRKWKLEFDIR